MSVDLILLILAVVCFAAATINLNSPINLLALGLLFYALRGLL